MIQFWMQQQFCRFSKTLKITAESVSERLPHMNVWALEKDFVQQLYIF